MAVYNYGSRWQHYTMATAIGYFIRNELCAIDISISIFFTLSIEDEGIIYVGPLFLYDLSKRAFLYFYYLIKYI